MRRKRKQAHRYAYGSFGNGTTPLLRVRPWQQIALRRKDTDPQFGCSSCHPFLAAPHAIASIAKSKSIPLGTRLRVAAHWNCALVRPLRQYTIGCPCPHRERRDQEPPVNPGSPGVIGGKPDKSWSAPTHWSPFRSSPARRHPSLKTARACVRRAWPVFAAVSWDRNC
jgi:hypothetical protein